MIQLKTKKRKKAMTIEFTYFNKFVIFVNWKCLKKSPKFPEQIYFYKIFNLIETEE